MGLPKILKQIKRAIIPKPYTCPMSPIPFHMESCIKCGQTAKNPKYIDYIEKLEYTCKCGFIWESETYENHQKKTEENNESA